MSDFYIPRFGRIIFCCLLIILQSACITDHGGIVGEPLFLSTPESGEVSSSVVSKDESKPPENHSSVDIFEEKSPHENLRSYSSIVSPPKSPILQSQLPFSHEKNVNLAVDNLLLKDFINHVFANILNVSFVVDPEIAKHNDKVTMNLESMVSEYRLYSLVCEQLQKLGISVHCKEDVFYVWGNASYTGARLGFGADEESIPGGGRIIQLMPVHYANARNLVDFLRNSKFDAKIICLKRENVIEVVGSREQVVLVGQMVKTLDRPALRGRYIDRIKFENYKSKAIIEELTEILISEGIPVAKQPGEAGVYFNALDDWRAILVFSAEKNWLNRVRYWVEVLDVPEITENKTFYVFFPENSRAVDLATSLKMMMGISKDDNSDGRLLNYPAEQAEKIDNKASPETKKVDGAKPKVDLSNNVLSLSGDEFNFGVDENRNALIFYTSGVQFRKIHNLLQRLDIQPLQILLEVTLAEVSLKDDLAYGLEWYLKNKFDDGSWVASTLGGLGLGSSGLNFAYINLSEKFKLAINAFAKDELVKILSTPRLMVRDGASASLNIGTEVPVLLSETSVPDLVVDGNSGITQSVQYRTTGITLNVTPTVHAQGTVTLIITQIVSEAQTNNTSTINSPLILNREITTEVVATDNQTVILAGLIKDNTSTTETRVPWIGDLPYIGNLFKTTSTSRDRTELVVMITPHIVHSQKEINTLREDIFDSFEWLTTTLPIADVPSPSTLPVVSQ